MCACVFSLIITIISIIATVSSPSIDGNNLCSSVSCIKLGYVFPWDGNVLFKSCREYDWVTMCKHSTSSR